VALETTDLPVTGFEYCGIMSSGLQIYTERHVFRADAYMTALCMHKNKCACDYVAHITTHIISYLIRLGQLLRSMYFSIIRY